VKVAIIGAGIGGLALGRALTRQGLDVAIYEQKDRYARTGLGLLLMPNGVKALDQLGLGADIRERSNPLDLGVLRKSDGSHISKKVMDGPRGISRLDLLTLLERGVEDNAVRWQQPLVDMRQDDDSVILNVGGSEMQADLIVGADGVRSTLRSLLLPDWQVNACAVTELVSVCDAPDIAALYDRTFVKHLAPEGRLAVGLVPASHGRVVWFVQFDNRLWPAKPSTPDEMRRFTTEVVGTWASPIPDLIERTDFVHTHLWRTPEPGPVAPMVHGRAVLIGDAAHAFPTLTSQGANAALVDAQVLAEEIGAGGTVHEALARFDARRAPRLEKIRRGGAALVSAFLSANAITELPVVA